QSGDRTTALRQFQRCAAAVAKEFNLTPSEETVALHEQLREDRLENGLGAAVRPPPRDAAAGDLLRDLHTRLDRMQTSLAAFQDQVQQLTALSRPLRENLQTTRTPLQDMGRRR